MYSLVSRTILTLLSKYTYLQKQGGATPWDTFTYGGVMTSAWGIDGTVLRFNSWGNYLVWSCMSSNIQCLCTAPLKSPTSLGTSSVISCPTQSWETVGAPVNEAPAALYHGGKTMLTYSGSYCWTNSYALGLLTWDGSSNPATSAAWSKKGPVLSSANGNYGTGHNGYVVTLARLFGQDKISDTWTDSSHHQMALRSGMCLPPMPTQRVHAMEQDMQWHK